MRASTSAKASISLARQASARSPSAPRIWRNAWRRCASVSAPIRSARPSTRVRSSRPFSNARRVNSPASAGRQPGTRASAASTAAITALPPCSCSSAVSSPVSLRGAGNHSASPSSIISPLAGSCRRASAAWRGGGIFPINACRAAPACGPDTRTTAIAAGGRPDDSAKMVSVALSIVESVDCRAWRKRPRYGDRVVEPQCKDEQRRTEDSFPTLTRTRSITIGPEEVAEAPMTSSPAPAAHENRLARATSPYLLQHKHNPVDWWPWGPQALAEAQRASKPILLSVGYAACHWCHVMAHESFEDDATAAVMNELFVNIKVDREERPDIDQIYMHALHMLGEQGGWPLTMFLTPAGEPVWGGTYFPKESRYGRPAFTAVCRELARVFREEPERIVKNRDALMQRLAAAASAERPVTIGLAGLDDAAAQLGRMIDQAHGGLRGAPKFPQSTMLENLWRAGVRSGDNRFFDLVELTLDRMCRGGIYDHLGGGFSRYSVDERWLVPHFEKMLYDNAQLLEL